MGRQAQGLADRDRCAARTWAHNFRDDALAAHADLFTFNEAPSTTGESDNVRVKIAKILRFIHEPDAMGRQLWGVVYLTERAATVSAYTSPAPDFFKAIDETSIALVAEHYHSTGFVCGLSETALADHFFAFRKWLVASGEPAKLSIANKKYTVLHSSRFNDGPSGWAGGDSTKSTLANYQRALSRISRVTRQTEGGVNRISFAPTTSNITLFGVQPRITGLFRWHYSHTAAQSTELPASTTSGATAVSMISPVHVYVLVSYPHHHQPSTYARTGTYLSTMLVFDRAHRGRLARRV